MNVMTLDALAVMECGNYTWHIDPPSGVLTPLPPPPPPPSPLTLGAQKCYNTPKGNNDISPSIQAYWANFCCSSWSADLLQPDVAISSNPPGTLQWIPSGTYGTTYSYMIQWIEGCSITGTSQSQAVNSPVPGSTCGDLLNGDYKNCKSL
jgi:hypothetical protein